MFYLFGIKSSSRTADEKWRCWSWKARKAGTEQTRKIPFHLHYYGNETEKPENVGLLSQRDCPPGPFIDYVGRRGIRGT